jgi:hypothetical protein
METDIERNLDESPLGEVVSGIPLPSPNPRRKLTSTARILASMGVGDSVRLSRVERDSIFAHAKNVGIRITTRAIDAETFRVWRLPDPTPEKAASAQP